MLVAFFLFFTLLRTRRIAPSTRARTTRAPRTMPASAPFDKLESLFSGAGLDVEEKAEGTVEEEDVGAVAEASSRRDAV